jgi:hypothetical protein
VNLNEVVGEVIQGHRNRLPNRIDMRARGNTLDFGQNPPLSLRGHLMAKGPLNDQQVCDSHADGGVSARGLFDAEEVGLLARRG